MNWSKRQFTAAELVAFASVLDVTMTYLLTPPPGSGPIEYEPGVIIGSDALSRALDLYRGVESQGEAFAEAGEAFFRHMTELRELAAKVRADMDHLVATAGMSPAERAERDAAANRQIDGYFEALDHMRNDRPGDQDAEGDGEKS
jgi:hypothetical protein